MEWLQTLVNDSSTPLFTAFLLGLLTAVSPCPLATNIAAVGYISKDVASKSRIFVNGMLYSFGRVLAYTLLGAVLIKMIPTQIILDREARVIYRHVGFIPTEKLEKNFKK